MDVKPGYKQSEVGVIPEEWGIVPFDDAFIRVNAKKNQINSGFYQDVGMLPVVDQGQDSIVGYTDRTDLKFEISGDGVVVFGDHTCTVKFIDFDFVVGADGTQILAAKDGQCVRFHAYELELKGVQSTGYNRHFKFLKERKFASPLVAEQYAIAATLGDVDALLAAQDALIVKRRAIKQGAMQLLLTGRCHLPGFLSEGGFQETVIGEIPAGWSLARLHDLVDPSRPIRYGIVQPGQYDSGGRYMVRGQDYSAAKGWALEEDLFRVSDAVEFRYRNARLRAGDLIMTIVGYCGHVEQIPDWLDGANLTQTTARISIDEGRAVGAFCRYMLQSDYGLRQVAENLKGAAQPGLNIRDVENFLIPIPPSIDEQRAISSVLKEMDAEIIALQQQRNKTAQLKQGMMQQLLTGRIRLI